jgi:hypothetical protein
VLRTRLHPTSGVFLNLTPCCYYITNMLRPVLRATSNIKSSPLSPRHKSQHHMSAHRNSTSTTLKFNVCNIQQHVYATSNSASANIES